MAEAASAEAASVADENALIGGGPTAAAVLLLSAAVGGVPRAEGACDSGNEAADEGGGAASDVCDTDAETVGEGVLRPARRGPRPPRTGGLSRHARKAKAKAKP